MDGLSPKFTNHIAVGANFGLTIAVPQFRKVNSGTRVNTVAQKSGNESSTPAFLMDRVWHPDRPQPPQKKKTAEIQKSSAVCFVQTGRMARWRATEGLSQRLCSSRELLPWLCSPL